MHSGDDLNTGMLPSEALLAAIVSSSDDAIVSKNLNGIITSWNEGAQRIFGYLPHEIVGQPVLKLIPVDRHDEEPRIIERLKRGERVDHFETIRVRKDGELFPVSLTISPVRNDAGEIVGASKIARDITGSRRTQADLERIAREREQLLESERAARTQAEQASRMKDEFIATVSHELRTPLNAIIGWAEILGHGEPTRQDIGQGIEIILRNAKVQAQLIEDLLDLGRLSSGKMALNLEALDLSIVVRDAVQAVQHAADGKGIKLIVPKVQGVVLGDAKRLRQVIWNLLTNAIKFTPAQGRVTVTVTRQNSHFQIEVADTGTGIPPEFLSRLFDRFSQADSSITRRHGGLGIGLALVRQLVELHAGEVTAESPGPGQGSIFRVNLPVMVAARRSQEEETVVAASPESGIPDLKGLHVLVVDDDPDSLDLITRILGSRNANVTAAGSAPEALALLPTINPDVVLSDIGMPVQDGYEFVRTLRSLPRSAAIPAVALTAMARPEDRTRAMTAGFQTHLAKPVTAAELVAVVWSLANLHRASPV